MKYWRLSRSFIAVLLSVSICLGLQAQVQVQCPSSVAQVQQLVCDTAKNNSTITIKGAGKGNSVKTTQKDTVVLDQEQMNKVINISVADKKITVQPGITWEKIQEFLNPLGLSVAVMQSYSDFSVGGTIGVNAHGQDFRFAPMVNTIESLQIVDADGQLKQCSPTENSELFSLVIGGYGLFGVITEVTLNLVDNTVLKKEIHVKDAQSFFGNDTLNDNEIALYSARFDVGSKSFMSKMIEVIYKDTHRVTNVPIVHSEMMDKIFTGLFNLARKFKFLRNIRMSIEERMEKDSVEISRNNAMYAITTTLSHEDDGYIDILQEYFIPLDRANEFIQQAKKILKKHDVDTLNCTLRYVKQDDVSFLPYAPKTVAAFVFYYTIKDCIHGFDKARVWTCELVDCAIDNGGRFYLPYYCFATKEQVRAAYPEFDDFIALKKQYDPKELFVNDLYLNYK